MHTCRRREILQHDVVKRRACEIDCGSVSETVDYIGMADAIERYCFVLKVTDESRSSSISVCPCK